MLLPLALLWLAAHAFVLVVILGLKALSARALLLLALIGGGLWFLMRRVRHPARLPAPPGMV